MALGVRKPETCLADPSGPSNCKRLQERMRMLRALILAQAVSVSLRDLHIPREHVADASPRCRLCAPGTESAHNSGA